MDETAACHGLVIAESELEGLLYEILSKQAQISLNLDNLSNAGQLDIQLAEQAEYDKRIGEYLDKKRVLYERLVLKQISMKDYETQKAANLAEKAIAECACGLSCVSASPNLLHRHILLRARLEVIIVVMTATVLSMRRGNLLVFDFSNRQQVQVNTNDAFRFCPGDLVRIRYNGAMTMSIPPQISATSIVRISPSRC